VQDEAAEDVDETITGQMDEVLGAIGPNTYVRIGASTRTGPDGRHLYAVAIMQTHPGAKSPWRTLSESCAATIEEAFGIALRKLGPRANQRPRL
jgi:hypothetical protein